MTKNELPHDLDATPEPEANDAPSAGGMFSCMVASAVMLLIYVTIWLIFVRG